MLAFLLQMLLIADTTLEPLLFTEFENKTGKKMSMWNKIVLKPT